MNILQIGTIDNSGGAASISWGIKKELEKQGFKMSMFVRDKNSTDENVHVVQQKPHRYIHYLLSNDIDLSSTDWIMETKEFKEADVIHFHNIHGWFFNLKTLQKMSKIKPVIWTLHDMWAITPHCAYSFKEKSIDGFYECSSKKNYPRIFWNNTKYLKWRKKNIYKNSSFTIITPSLWLKNKVKDSVLKNKEIKLIYNGINTEIFKKTNKEKTKKELNIPLDKKVILFLSEGGALNPLKGWLYVESLIKKNIKDLLFVSIGGDKNKKDEVYKNLIHLKRIEDKKILGKYFSIADIFLFPSTADNCPLVVLEAMACETPIVTFKTGGIPELVTHLENGYVANYKDLEDLCKGVEYILGLNEEEIAKIGNQSRIKVLKYFDEINMISKYKELYQDIIQKYKNK